MQHCFADNMVDRKVYVIVIVIDRKLYVIVIVIGTALPYITQSRGCGFCYARYVHLDDDLSRQDFWTCSRWILLSKWFSQFLTVKVSRQLRHRTSPNKFLMCQNLICFHSACYSCGKLWCAIQHDYVLNCTMGDFLRLWQAVPFNAFEVSNW